MLKILFMTKVTDLSDRTEGTIRIWNTSKPVIINL